jgi:hypothetical protein
MKKFFATLLIAPTMIVLGLALLETRFLHSPPANGATQGMVWGGRTFATHADSLGGFDRGVSPIWSGFSGNPASAFVARGSRTAAR